MRIYVQFITPHNLIHAAHLQSTHMKTAEMELLALTLPSKHGGYGCAHK